MCFYLLTSVSGHLVPAGIIIKMEATGYVLPNIDSWSQPIGSYTPGKILMPEVTRP